jgi:hypothetical protein
VDPAPERVAAAVIRAWIEPGGALKIRITTAGDVDGAAHTVGVASSIDVACTMVRAWLESLSLDAPGASRDRRRAS